MELEKAYNKLMEGYEINPSRYRVSMNEGFKKYSLYDYSKYTTHASSCIKIEK